MRCLPGRSGRPASQPGNPSKNRRFARVVGVGFACAYLVLLVYNLTKPLPAGISVEGPLRPVDGMEFMADLTFQVGQERRVEQRIFDRVISMIEAAEGFVVIDMFLFKGQYGEETGLRPLARELTQSLVEKKTFDPDLEVWFITDEINNFYGAYTSREIARLQEAGIEVVATRTERLRDSNPAFSAFWRMLFGWFGTAGPGWLPDIINSSGRRVTARAYVKMLNFKANHRKLIVTDKECLITSANPHDGSSLHSNIGFVGAGPICGDLLDGERAVAAFSGGTVQDWPAYPAKKTQPGGSRDGGEAGPGQGTVQMVTEGKIRSSLLDDLAAAGLGHQVDLAMFYLSERGVVEALLAAEERGASIRLILDSNKDAFGREKNGIPNRQVAGELVRKSEGRIQVRWYDTRGEQFHTKLVRVAGPGGVVIMGGSANLTRRNIRDYNLEADLRFSLSRNAPLALAVEEYIERIFTNDGGDYTLPFEAYRDESWIKGVLYRLEEFTGFCSF
ncbi:MAG: phospholipase [Gemmatimonadetes bacterium]|nr:phospholipase D family protein [Gemmatimonadota bacterium]NNM04214.1 phospholipase [Gemmatimonadota bacterium]